MDESPWKVWKKVELSEAEIFQIKTCSITLLSPESESGSELSDIFENLKKKFLNSYISMIIYILAPQMKEMMNLHCYLKIPTRKMLKIWKIVGIRERAPPNSKSCDAKKPKKSCVRAILRTVKSRCNCKCKKRSVSV